MGPGPPGLGGGAALFPPSLPPCRPGGRGSPSLSERGDVAGPGPASLGRSSSPTAPHPEPRVGPAPGSARFPEHASPRRRGQATWLPQPARSPGRAGARTALRGGRSVGGTGGPGTPAPWPRSRFWGSARLLPLPRAPAPAAPPQPPAPRTALGAGTRTRTPCSCPGRGLGDPVTLRPAASPRTLLPMFSFWNLPPPGPLGLLHLHVT